MNQYSTNFDPPALCLDVTVGNVLNRRKRRTIYALLNTGADITAIPGDCVDLLGLYKIDRLRLETVEGTASIIYTYAVRFTLGDFVIPLLEVILTGFDIVLVGRDVLNQLYLQLDGPQQQFTFQTTPFTT